jgi:hypothetical protein
MRIIWLTCLLAASTARANTPKELTVNSGTRAKNQYRGTLEAVAISYNGHVTGSPKAVAVVRLTGPNLTPQCVVHLGSLADAVALAAQIQSDKTKSVHCIDETIDSSTVILHFPLRPADYSDCPKGNRCSGQWFSIEAQP